MVTERARGAECTISAAAAEVCERLLGMGADGRWECIELVPCTGFCSVFGLRAGARFFIAPGRSQFSRSKKMKSTQRVTKTGNVSISPRTICAISRVWISSSRR